MGFKSMPTSTGNEEKEQKIEELQDERKMLKEHIIRTGGATESEAQHGEISEGHMNEDSEGQYKRLIEVEEELKKLGVEDESYLSV